MIFNISLQPSTTTSAIQFGRRYTIVGKEDEVATAKKIFQRDADKRDYRITFFDIPEQYPLLTDVPYETAVGVATDEPSPDRFDATYYDGFVTTVYKIIDDLSPDAIEKAALAADIFDDSPEVSKGKEQIKARIQALKDQAKAAENNSELEIVKGVMLGAYRDLAEAYKALCQPGLLSIDVRLKQFFHNIQKRPYNAHSLINCFRNGRFDPLTGKTTPAADDPEARSSHNRARALDTAA